eukprot:UN31935
MEEGRDFDGGTRLGLFIMIYNYVWFSVFVFILFAPVMLGPFLHLSETLEDLREFHKIDWPILIGPKEWKIDIKYNQIDTIEKDDVESVVKQYFGRLVYDTKSDFDDQLTLCYMHETKFQTIIRNTTLIKSQDGEDT